MYRASDLKKYEYFKNIDYNFVLDSLTGTIARTYILDFAKDLIKKNEEFTMAIFDIDNFKMINDTYGHKCGDVCLEEVGNNLVSYINDDGLVGRFGGDEFIIILFGKRNYDEVRAYLFDLFNGEQVIKRNYYYGDKEIFITATVGCASYPKDARNYDELFLTIDKTLYRGKTKGRNCFIIYVEEKHKNINVYNKDSSRLSYIFGGIRNIYIENFKKSSDVIIKKIIDYCAKELGLCEIAFIKNDRTVISTNPNSKHEIKDECIDLLDSFIIEDEEVYIPSDVCLLRNRVPQVSKFLDEKRIITFAESRIKYNKKIYGFTLFFENQIERIWQDSHKSLLMYLDNLFYIILKTKKS